LKLSSAARAALWPVSLIWGAAARLKVFGYRHGAFRTRMLPGNVISVGNLTVGGTGKTPMVIWLVERLLTEGKRVAILTRGYQSRRDSVGISQSDEIGIFRERFGDRVPIGVGADRYARGAALAREGISWFVLDDGFQHLRLARSANIVLLDATDPFGGGRLLPAGGLREPKSALRRADIIVVTRAGHAPAIETVAHRYTNAPIFYANPEITELCRWAGNGAQAIGLARAEWSGLRFFAFCGIGNPKAFVQDLKQVGLHIVGREAFADHHRYSQREFDRLQAKAREAGAALLCTEKDRFNLGDVAIGSVPVYFARMNMRPSDPAGYWQAIEEICRRSSGMTR